LKDTKKERFATPWRSGHKGACRW